MAKKNSWLVAALIVLAGIYVCFFTSWFKPRTIKIFYTTRPMRSFVMRHYGPPVFFGLEGNFRLTEVKVVPLADFQAHPDAPPLWHLITDSKSPPVSRFVYGQRIRGMKPAVAGEGPQMLQTNVMYRLFVAAGSIKGWCDFEIK